MATKDFLLPDLGEGLTEGEIVSWLVAVGDTVEVDQPVAEVETAKAVVEVPSPFAGKVSALHGEVGQEVAVGAPLVSIEVGAGADSAGAEPSLGGKAVIPATGPGTTPMEIAAEEALPDARPDRPVDGPEQGTITHPDGEDTGSGSVLVGYGTGGGGRSRRRRSSGNGSPAATPSSGPPPRPGASGPAGSGPAGRPLAKPPVRKFAKDLGIDLAAVRGSGPGGVITRDDVRAHAGNGAGGAASAAPVVPAQPEPGVVVTTPDHQPLGSAPPNEERIPVRGVRRAISEKMTLSRREIPEATTWVDCDATGLWKLRERLNRRQDDVRVSPLAIVLRACVAGLRQTPMVNARLDTNTNEIVVPSYVNVGFAAQTDRGLIVPVIKGADRLSVLGIASELNRLATAARDSKVTPEEMTGGTFTVSNYGSFGVDGGSAVINFPEAAILGVGRIVDKPWAVDGKVKVRKVMQLSIAFDHRICDGGEAAGFLRFVADCVEDPDVLLASL